ncbi:restriction endonuclease subunit S [Xanthomonas fragariae]|uniref:restriction endonuclease subunit S n=1 Tax=Xanthomonas fragariae TaxID=48664 RepID=UPI000D556F14|nr:restriction endonuclease subunit S [Xanthomonas fragariae]MDM7555085.1 restriction endonuclease subunit S [Xanthomonas fragariae]MDM7558219.1 restriction endonuclease subunit S [Xanthomonas fragariae]MDM7575921.1 restriction endonuclease subunit S [Xanthomonas fragariae]MDM7578971.1 restriction endonuclease subunit S [Xanthomonas fragariae]MDM7589224.1 restriction endonuclease subunit S [Xanthomonas fragariae]
MLPDGWRRTTLGDIGSVKSGSTPARSQHDRYFVDGKWPWVKTMDLTNSEILTTDEVITDAALAESSCRLFPAGTVLVAMYGGFKQIGRTGLLREKSAVNQAISAIDIERDQADPEFVLHWLNGSVETWKNYAASSRKDPNITRENVCEFPVILPTLVEQRRIAHILSTWDQAIAITERLLANSRHQKMLLSQQVLTGKSRLAGFTASGHRKNTPYGSVPVEWDYPRIGDVAAEISEKLGDSEPHPVLSCTKHHGLVDSLKYFKKQVFSLNTSTYKVAPRGCFVYATNHIDEGSIGYQNLYEAGLISPMYTAFKTSDKVVDTYLFALLKTEHYRQIFASAINASVDRRGSLRWKDFQRIHIPLPPVEEQQAIATMLAQAGREVALIRNQLDLLREEKSALMSQLLTGKRRVRLPADEAEPA